MNSIYCCHTCRIHPHECSTILCLSQERGENGQPMREEDLINLIDDVLRDDDKNNDGYIDYAEFAKSLE